MSSPKTQPTGASVDDFLAALEPERRRDEAREIVAMMAEASGEPPEMWGPTIVGFGRYTYRYETGRTGDWMRIGMSPRKGKHVLYLMGGFDSHETLLGRLGKHKTGASCLYVNKLADVDRDVLRELIAASLAHMDATHPRA